MLLRARCALNHITSSASCLLQGLLRNILSIWSAWKWCPCTLTVKRWKWFLVAARQIVSSADQTSKKPHSQVYIYSKDRYTCLRKQQNNFSRCGRFGKRVYGLSLVFTVLAVPEPRLRSSPGRSKPKGICCRRIHAFPQQAELVAGKQNYVLLEM